MVKTCFSDISVTGDTCMRWVPECRRSYHVDGNICQVEFVEEIVNRIYLLDLHRVVRAFDCYVKVSIGTCFYPYGNLAKWEVVFNDGVSGVS